MQKGVGGKRDGNLAAQHGGRNNLEEKVKRDIRAIDNVVGKVGNINL